MRSTIAMATFAALAAGTLGVSAKDSISNMAGSDTLKNMTQDVIANCGANCSGLTYIGTGSGNGQNNIEGGTIQAIAPMSRAVNTGICDTQTAGGPNTRTTEGIVVALDGVDIVADAGNACNGTNQGLRRDLTGSGSSTAWRDVLRTLYTGMPAGSSTDVLARDCNSSVRRNLINNWDDLFEGTCSTCTDSNPDGAVTEPGVRHAFRRDEESGTTDVFLTLLSLGTISFTQNAPAGYPADAQPAFRALANSPYCNVLRPNDAYRSTGVTLTGGVFSALPAVFYLGDAPAGGFDHDNNPATPKKLRSLIVDPLNFDNGNDVSFPEFQDQDPVRRKCPFGKAPQLFGVVATEDVCGPDGQLGVVLPINPPPIAIADAYPTEFCSENNVWNFGPGVQNAFGAGILCPDGSTPLGAPPECFIPSTDTGGRACLHFGGNFGNNTPESFTPDGGPPASFGNKVGDTIPTGAIDGRVYNLILRSNTGAVRTISRPNPAALGTISVPMTGSFYRIHSARSMIAAAPTTKTCKSDDATTQLGCLVQASPCSVAYAGGNAVALNSPGTISLKVNNIDSSVATIQNLVSLAGPVYPFARKLYVNSMRGFMNPLTPFTGTDAETDLVKAYVTESVTGACTPTDPACAFGGALPTEHGFVTLPGSAGPFCEDFNENGVCGALNGHCTVTVGTTCNADGSTANCRLECAQNNTNACADNSGGIPANTAYCGNGTVDAGEQCDDGNAITDTQAGGDTCSVTCRTTL
jgi:cysteine-rich repeat protein